MVIYKILCKHNGKIYVGSTVNFKKRKNQHINKLKSNKHHNYLLQKIYNKHGLENLVFEIIEEVLTHDELIVREEYHINRLDTYNNGLNLKEYYERKQSFSLSEEAKQKISKALSGKKKTKEHIKNLSKARKGKPQPKLRGLKRTPEQLENIKNGVINSEKQKMSWVKSRKKIIQYTLDGELIKEWDSIKDAAKEYGTENSSNLIKVLKKRGKSFKGYFWEYA